MENKSRLKINTNSGMVYYVSKLGYFSETKKWIFKGVNFRSNSSRIKYTFDEIWENPELAIKGYIFDIDHDTTRRWSDKISHCHMEE